MNAAPDPSASRDEDSIVTMRPGSEPELGRIDQYAVLRRLGGGGYGVVYLARDTVSGVLFALKTLHPLVKRNPEELGRVRRSFALVSGLAHDGIAGARVLHEVREAAFSDETARRELLLSPGDFVMVLTYAPGVTLSAWTRQFPNGVAPLARALEVGAQVAAALDYAHGKGVVHRDVKPGNVMVETLAAGPQASKLRVRILDFGLAAEIRSSLSRVSNEKGDVSGTRPYMAPEQWRGKKQDGRTDQYALSCMLYELLSGDPPFAGAFETGDEAIMRSVVLNEAPDPVEGLSPAANAALLRALAKDPKERFPTCAAFVAALEGRDGSTSRPPDGRAAGASHQATSAVEDEAALLLRKAAMQDALAAIPDADRADKEFGPIADEAIHAFAAAEDALKFGRPVVAATCLDRADAAFARLCESRLARREEERRQEMARREQEEKWQRREEEERRRREEERRAHEQVISSLLENMVAIPGRNYRMSKCEVTQAQWEAVMGDNPSRFQSGDDYPVECVSWNDCQVFLEKLNLLPAVRDSGLVFRLPTEQEWEHACRAGAAGPYCRLVDGTEITEESLDRVAWFDNNSGKTTHPVGLKDPNAFGLCDMHGNVWEWTQTAVGEDRVNRGGSWDYTARHCEASRRYWLSPDYRDNSLGFRLCASGRTDTVEFGNREANLMDSLEDKPLSLQRKCIVGRWFLRLRSEISRVVGWRRTAEAAARAAAERERRREEEVRLEAKRQREELDRVCADAKRPQRRKAWIVVGSLFAVLLVSVIVGLLKSCTGSRETPEPPMSESRRAAVVEQLVRNMVPIPGKDYRMGKYEVTQEEWEAVTGERPSHFTGDRRPVERVSWNDCQAFIGKLNALPAVRSAGLMFRLPTEEEWEYACRAGATGAYCRLPDGTEITETTLGRVAWFDKNAAHKTHPVGGKESNAFGLFDTHGNVWEWTQTADGVLRVYRGGGCYNSARNCESSGRGLDLPSDWYYGLGFRLCASGRAD